MPDLPPSLAVACAGQTFVRPVHQKHAPKPPSCAAPGCATMPRRPLDGRERPLLAEGGARETAHPCARGRVRASRARTRATARAIPAFGCDARRRLRVPTSKATPTPTSM
ncbi:MAG: hypothetical protein MZV70_41775 [Desulfobacterales bacterium]|nr:hypothetical protein [Desulfobacterales bacterium]